MQKRHAIGLISTFTMLLLFLISPSVDLVAQTKPDAAAANRAVDNVAASAAAAATQRAPAVESSSTDHCHSDQPGK